MKLLGKKVLLFFQRRISQILRWEETPERREGG
jgi:hypothetical protein